MRNIGYKPQNLMDIARMIGVINEDNVHLKFEQYELAAIVIGYIDALERRIYKAKDIYREQRNKLERLENPQLWRFHCPESVPPDYRAEYLRRLNAGKVKVVSENGLRLVKTPSGMKEEHV